MFARAGMRRGGADGLEGLSCRGRVGGGCTGEVRRGIGVCVLARRWVRESRWSGVWEDGIWVEDEMNAGGMG